MFNKENLIFKNEIMTLKRGKEKEISNTFVLENNELKDQVKNLTNILTQFTNGRDNLDKLLGMQSCIFNKAGLGHNQVDNQKDYKNFFKTYTPHDPTSLCSYCGRNTHNVQYCHYKNNDFSKGKLA